MKGNDSSGTGKGAKPLRKDDRGSTVGEQWGCMKQYEKV